MTNILELPQLQATFAISNNSDWTDRIKFLKPSIPDDANSPLVPLDLTGIEFRGQMRPATDSPVVALEVKTADMTIVNSGTDGMLTWNVPALMFDGMEAGDYVFDLLAFGDGHVINLFEKAGAAAVTVNEGVTKPASLE